MITGLAVMGFGFGGALMGQVAPILILKFGVAATLYISGLIFLAVLLLAAQRLNNPPEEWNPPPPAKKTAVTSVAVSVDFKKARGMYQFYLLWLILFINVTAGIALISNLSPMAQAQVGLTVLTAGTLVFVASLFNGIGRMFWASLSDKLGRKNVFLLILGTQIPVFLLLPKVTSVPLFGALCCYILFCYGGGFATMPCFATDTFGPKNIGSIYGSILLAWSVAGVVGPMLMERIKQISGNFGSALNIASILLVMGFLLTTLYRHPPNQSACQPSS
jgi:OFA family oxalate/formate antiporter-like MFS transporter